MERSFKKIFRRTTQEIIQSQIEEGIQTKQKIIDSLLPDIEAACHMVVDAIENGRKILFFGNGGSASDAQHLSAEFVGRYQKERRPLPAIALTTDTSILTAVANDYEFGEIFARQISALGQPGDVAVGVSTSGNSKNVIRGIETAKAKELRTLVLTGGMGGQLAGMADVTLAIPSKVTSRIQESHIMIGHIICDVVDRSLF